MCMYCERRQDIPFGWDQPKLPYHNPSEPGSNLSGNIADFDQFEGVIHDYQTSMPKLILTCNGYFGGDGVGTVYIPIKYCPECGRKLGESLEHKNLSVMQELIDTMRKERFWTSVTLYCNGHKYVSERMLRQPYKLKKTPEMTCYYDVGEVHAEYLLEGHEPGDITVMFNSAFEGNSSESARLMKEFTGIAKSHGYRMKQSMPNMVSFRKTEEEKTSH